MLANPYVLIAIAVFYAGSLGAVGWKAYNAGEDHVIAQQKREDSIEERSRIAALQVAAEAIAKIEVKNEYRTQKLVTETVEKPVYRDCVNTDATFGLLNESLTAPEDRLDTGDGIVPKTESADR